MLDIYVWPLVHLTEYWHARWTLGGVSILGSPENSTEQ